MPTLERIARRVSVAVLSFAVASLVATSDAAAQCGQEFRGAPTSSDVPGGPPLAIGDSVLADAVPELVRYGFEADGMVCRQMSQGLDLLRARGERLPHLVVLALGANGEVTDRQISEALALLGPRRILALVTPHGGVSPSTPGVIRAAAAANPTRIVLLDWDRLAGEHPDWLAPDGVHLGGSAGIEGFAAMIAGALSYANPPAREPEGENIDPGAPETLPSPPIRHNTHPRRRPPVTKKPHRAESSTAAQTRTVAPAAAVPRKSDPARRKDDGGDASIEILAVGAAALAALAVLLIGKRRARRRS